MGSEVADLVDQAMPNTIALRRDLHRFPEVGLTLPRTQAKILEELDGLGLNVQVGEAVSSVSCVLDGDREGPTILMRADMDALPMPEDTGLDFASQIDGVMHGCGHDAHTAMLVAAAHILHQCRGQLAGRVLFMFQPGEEGYHGARCMIEEGLLDHDRVGEVFRAFAVHQTPAYASGTISGRAGPFLAAADFFRIVVTGRGGHAAGPHVTRDPIPTACEIVQAIQTAVARRINIFDPAIVSVTQLNAGTTTNVIPERAEIRGTIRTLSHDTREAVSEMLQRLAAGIAAAHEMEATVEIDQAYPVTVNDDVCAEWALSVATESFGADRVIRMPRPLMGSEDFSYVLNEVPGTMVFLGTCPTGTEPGHAAANHSNRMVIDEAAMATGIEMYVQAALSALA